MRLKLYVIKDTIIRELVLNLDRVQITFIVFSDDSVLAEKSK